MPNLIQFLRECFPTLTLCGESDCPTITIPAEEAAAFFAFIGTTCESLCDLAGTDWGLGHSPRYSVFYHFWSRAHRSYLRVRVDCPSPEAPLLPSIASWFPTADWHEREAFDLFGIQFSGHPNLKRILLWDKFNGHPLRKDFPLAGKPDAETLEHPVPPAPLLGGPFCSRACNNTRLGEPESRETLS